MEHQDLETCQALKRLGFSQDDTEFAWALYRGKPIREFGFSLLKDGEYQWIAVDRNYSSSWCACPSPLEALEWLEREKGVHFWRDDRFRDWYATHEGWGGASKLLYVYNIVQELVRAVCARLEADAVEEQAKQKEEG